WSALLRGDPAVALDALRRERLREHAGTGVALVNDREHAHRRSLAGALSLQPDRLSPDGRVARHVPGGEGDPGSKPLAVAECALHGKERPLRQSQPEPDRLVRGHSLAHRLEAVDL